jgi:hypothetical protein
MSEYVSFSAGVSDAESDLANGWVPSGGPTEKSGYTLDLVVNNLRTMIGATDSYIAGYLSVLYGV